MLPIGGGCLGRYRKKKLSWRPSADKNANKSGTSAEHQGALLSAGKKQRGLLFA